jgi:hypothetical protein
LFNALKFSAHYAELYVFYRSHLFVTDTDSYWFGPHGDDVLDPYAQVGDERVAASGADLALSWQDRVVPRLGRVSLWLVVKWGSETSPPRLNMSRSWIPARVSVDTVLIARGSVSDDDPHDFSSVYLVVDEEFPDFLLIEEDLFNGDTFSYPVFAFEWFGRSNGFHTLVFYAIDSSGTICEAPVRFSVTMVLPSPTVYASGSPLQTVRSASASLSRPVARSRSVSATAFPTRTVELTLRQTATPVGSPVESKSPTDSAVPPLSETPTQSRMATRSRSRTRAPRRSPSTRDVEIDAGGVVVLTSGLEEKVILRGKGTIIGGLDEDLVLAEVTITSGAQILARGLTIVDHLTLSGTGTLGPIEGNSIFMPNDTVVIEMSASGKDLPTLNLGEVGSRYGILPKVLKVQLPVGLTAQELVTFSHPLVIGNTFSNCEAWRALLAVTSSEFRSECVSGNGGKLLSEARSLVIKGVAAPVPVPATASDSPHPTELSTGMSGGAVAGVVVGVVVVAGGAAAGLFLFIRRRGSGSSGNEP